MSDTNIRMIRSGILYDSNYEQSLIQGFWFKYSKRILSTRITNAPGGKSGL